ncbi:MAG TPA: Ppx/GppA phosphatase family protein [Luteitalea sp.]|nr:Ppx/GppA phosphatase family protein [Luteitalea sp.]
MRIAAIDIGTNSVHMIVVQVHGDRSFEVIDREKMMVRLGAGGLDGKALTPQAMAAAIQALAKFRRLAEARGVDEIVAAATSATREAENGGDFLNAVRDETGIAARVITGGEEARLIHLAAGYNTEFTGPTVVVDIGGGSVEITHGAGAEPELARSFKVGVIRLTERFLKSDPPSPRDVRRLVKQVEKEIGPYCDMIRSRGFVRVIGTSGTITSLGALALLQQGATVGDISNLRVPAKAIHKLRKTLVEMDQHERMQVEGLDPRRADIAPAGILLIDTILRALGATEVTLSDFALREGLVLDYIRSHQQQIASMERYPDVRRRSVMELGDRFHYWTAHPLHVAALSLKLFDQTQSVHHLSDRERELLEFGALLHDVGMHISHKSHHKHSYYLIQHGGLRGLSPEEIEVVALVARYHRRGKPKKSHEAYAELRSLTRRTVRTLTAIVGVAEGLDRSHSQVVKDVTLVDQGAEAVLRVDLVGDAELELWATQHHLAPFEALLGKPVRLEAMGSGVNTGGSNAGTSRRTRAAGRTRDEELSGKRRATRRDQHTDFTGAKQP